jgi:hypothetical protein
MYASASEGHDLFIEFGFLRNRSALAIDGGDEDQNQLQSS